eukprot:13711573-Ditylum_brightwellii.AAC.1
MYKDYNGPKKKRYDTVDRGLFEEEYKETLQIHDQSKHEVDVLKECSDNKKVRLTIRTRESESVITGKEYFKYVQHESQESTEILTPGSVDKNVNHVVAKGK